MSFISCSFLILFSITFAGRFFFDTSKTNHRYLFFLLVVSLVFYGSYVPSYLLLLLGITWIDFFVGRKIAEAAQTSIKKGYLFVSLFSNLGILSYYKYYNFFLDNLQAFRGLLGYSSPVAKHLDLILPLGISFFTFQSMSYTLDIYRGILKPERRYWRFLLFVSFFTHLISGPIVRAKELLYQFNRSRKPRLRVILTGLGLMIRGFFLKMVVADNLAYAVNRYWTQDHIQGGSVFFSLGLAALFSCQIYADFDGYTSIARGSAYLLGFRLPVNFNLPYNAGTFKDFWNRWHITLSHWMRDYLYIPLGGNRGSTLANYRNLFLVMVIAGFWHGAAYTFIIWGAMHGTALVLERILGFQDLSKKPAWLKFFWFLVVQLTVLIAWIFFRARGLDQAGELVGNLFTNRWGLESIGPLSPGLVFVLPILLMHTRGFLADKKWVSSPKPLEQAVWCAIMFYCLLSFYGNNSEFIYFKF